MVALFPSYPSWQLNSFLSLPCLLLSCSVVMPYPYQSRECPTLWHLPEKGLWGLSLFSSPQLSYFSSVPTITHVNSCVPASLPGILPPALQSPLLAEAILAIPAHSLQFSSIAHRGKSKLLQPGPPPSSGWFPGAPGCSLYTHHSTALRTFSCSLNACTLFLKVPSPCKCYFCLAL